MLSTSWNGEWIFERSKLYGEGLSSVRAHPCDWVFGLRPQPYQPFRTAQVGQGEPRKSKIKIPGRGEEEIPFTFIPPA